MPAIGNIVVNDAKGTPVAHTYAPVTTDGTLARLANRAATTPAGFETLQVDLRQPTSTTGAYRLSVKANDPVTATVDGSDVVVRNSSCELTFNFSQMSTSQERLDLLKKMSNALNHATIVAVAQNVEPIY
jgi:hypothetical protein